MLLPCDFGQRFREISDCVSPAEEKKHSRSRSGGLWWDAAKKQTKKQQPKRNTGYFPQPQMARTGALTRVFITRSTHGPLATHRLVPKEGRAISRRFTGARAQPKHTLARHHTQKRPIRDRQPTHGGPDGLLPNVATACRRSTLLHRRSRSRRSVTLSSPG